MPLLADGCGIVVSTGASPAAKKWQGRRVLVNPGQGWKDSADGPEEAGGYRILGGTKVNANGTGQEYMVVEAGEVEEAPPHLSNVEAAALPLTGLTAWRAVMVKAGEAHLGRRKKVLVTGIGGGVALMALAFAVATGAQVWVTSGSEDKIARAVELGASGGVSYREEEWEKKLLGLLGKEEGGGGSGGSGDVTAYFDAIVDGAGGDAVEKGAKILKVSREIYAHCSWRCKTLT